MARSAGETSPGPSFAEIAPAVEGRVSRVCRRAAVALLASSCALSLLLAPSAGAADGRLHLLGQYVLPSRLDFQGTTVGGLSGITYDAQRNVYYAVSDDRGEYQAPRFYTLEIDVGPGGIGGVRVVGVTTLDSDAATPGIQPYDKNASDTEDVALTPRRELIISSERDQQGTPWLRRFALDGSLLGEVPIPERFLPASEPAPDGKPVQTRGVRTNLGFEGVALSPDGATMYVANEEALAQDGPIASLAAGTTVRVLRYELGSGGWRPGAEVAYRTEPIFRAPEPATEFADNGVSALLWANQLWSDLDLLAMERSYATGVGNDVRIFGVRLAGAQRTEGLAALPTPFSGPLATKVPLVRMSDVGVNPDNLEGMTLGPRLSNGKPSLIVISDDNFNVFQPPQINQFLLFELNDTTGAPPAAPPSGPGPAQVPAALPRTGTFEVGGPLLALGAFVLGIGLALRRAARRLRV